MELLPGSIKFYCPHSREHPDKCGLKEPANPTASRADRKHEEKRVYFNTANPCKFCFIVRRAKACPLSQQLVKPQHGHKQYLKCEVKCDWFIDGEAQQLQEKRKRTKAVLVHNMGILARRCQSANRLPDICKYVEDQAGIQVSIPSISSGILEKFGCVITDQSLYHALGGDTGTDYVIDSLTNKVFVQKKSQPKPRHFCIHSVAAPTCHKLYSLRT